MDGAMKTLLENPVISKLGRTLSRTLQQILRLSRTRTNKSENYILFIK